MIGYLSIEHSTNVDVFLQAAKKGKVKDGSEPQPSSDEKRKVKNSTEPHPSSSSFSSCSSAKDSPEQQPSSSEKDNISEKGKGTKVRTQPNLFGYETLNTNIYF